MKYLFMLRPACLLAMFVILSTTFSASNANAEPTCSNYEFYVEATPRASSKANQIAQYIYDVLNKDKNGLVSYSLNYIFNDQTFNGYEAEARRFNLSSNSSICIQPSGIDISLLASSIRKIERKKGSCEGVYTYLELAKNLVKDASRSPNTKIHAYYTFICPFTDNATFTRDLAMSENEFIKYKGEINKLSNLNIHKLKERRPGVSEQDIYAEVLPKLPTVIAAKMPPKHKKIKKDLPVTAQVKDSTPVQKKELEQEKEALVTEAEIVKNGTVPIVTSDFQNCTKLKFDNSTLLTCDVEAEKCGSDLLKVRTTSNYPSKTNIIEIIYATAPWKGHIGETTQFTLKNGNNKFTVTEIKSQSETLTLPFIFN